MTPPQGRVLVVDDDPGIRAFLVGALEDERYQVREAANGREALDTMNQWLPDAILLDLYMPEMDGWTFRATQLALGSPAADIPVIVISAGRNLGPRTQDLRPAAVMGKPFELEALLEHLARVVVR